MVLTGWKNLVSAIATHIGVLVGILGLLALSSRSSRPRDLSARDFARLILRGIFVVLATLACAVVAFKVTGFRDRWFLPVFVWLPVALVVLWQHRLGAKQLRAIFALAGAAALLVIVAIPSRIWFAEKLGRRELLNAPFDKFAGDIRTASPHTKCFVAEDFWVGGNLRLQIPEAAVLTPQLPKMWRVEAGSQNCLVVWDATRKRKSDDCLDPLKALAEFDENSASFVEETLKFHQSRTLRLGMANGKTKP